MREHQDANDYAANGPPANDDFGVALRRLFDPTPLDDTFLKGVVAIIEGMILRPTGSNDNTKKQGVDNMGGDMSLKDIRERFESRDYETGGSPASDAEDLAMAYAWLFDATPIDAEFVKRVSAFVETMPDKPGKEFEFYHWDGRWCLHGDGPDGSYVDSYVTTKGQARMLLAIIFGDASEIAEVD